MKLEQMAVDPAAIEEGRWVGNLPELPDVQVRVRGFGNRDYRALQQKLMRSVSGAQRALGMGVDEQDRQQTTLLVETILLDWKGIDIADGVPLPFSKEKALELLSDPRMVKFRGAVIFAASLVGEQEAAEAETDAKN